MPRAAALAHMSDNAEQPAPANDTVATIAPEKPTPARVEPPPSPAVTLMLRRGDELLATGDIISARRFFERAASSGSAAAMCGIGKSFDPLFLRGAGVIGIAGDAEAAIAWYRKAADAGSNDARARLERLRATYAKNSKK